MARREQRSLFSLSDPPSLSPTSGQAKLGSGSSGPQARLGAGANGKAASEPATVPPDDDE